MNTTADYTQGRTVLAHPDEDWDKWLRARRGLITASSAASCLGLGRMTPLQAWMSITGRDELKDNDRLRAGRYFEDGTARWFADDVPAVRVLPTPGLVQHPVHEWFAATPDRILEYGVATDGVDATLPGVLEVKTVDRMFKNEWDEGAPVDYSIQLQLQLATMGFDRGSFGVTVGGNEFFPLHQGFEPVQTSQILAALEDFYRAYVYPDKAPPMTPEIAHDHKLFTKLHPRDNGEVVELSDDAAQAAAALEQLTADEKRIGAQIATCKGLIKAEIVDASFGVLPDGTGFSWKHSEIHHKEREARIEDRRTFRRASAKAIQGARA